MRLDLFGKIVRAAPASEHYQASSLCGRTSRINPIALVNRCHSLVFSTSCWRPLAVSEKDLFRLTLYGARYALPVTRAEQEGFENEQVERALQEGDAIIGIVLGRHPT